MDVTSDFVVIKSTVDRLRVQMMKRLLGPGRGRKLLDLGAGPCIFSRVARDQGWDVTAVDGRVDILPDDMTGITFIKADVREFDPSGFDTILNLGLLYHLPLADQERLLARCSYARVILETQVHTPGVVPEAAEPWGHDLITVRRRHGDFVEWPAPEARIRRLKRFDAMWQRAYPRLSRRAHVYQGLVFPETHGVRFENWRASIGNDTSFWQTERSLLRMFEECGYESARVIEPTLYSTYGVRKFYVLNDSVQARSWDRAALDSLTNEIDARATSLLDLVAAHAREGRALTFGGSVRDLDCSEVEVLEAIRAVNSASAGRARPQPLGLGGSGGGWEDLDPRPFVIAEDLASLLTRDDPVVATGSR